MGDLDIIGNAYEYLIGKFAAGAGKKAGEFYTPPQVSILLARLLDPRPGDRICDPAAGSSSLLIDILDDNHALKASWRQVFSSPESATASAAERACGPPG